jgi:drug/metabolite transporter (DMT)-like permease
VSRSGGGALLGLLAAGLFGVSAPLAKVLLGSVPPVLLAGLLYLGAAAGLWVYRAVKGVTPEAPLSRADSGRLGVVVLAGGIVAPVLMLLGLEQVTAMAGSLLLNLEAPFTVLLAVWVFGEHLGRAGVIAVSLIVSGALVLRLEPGAFGGAFSGMALISGACACWALDNNLTQRLSLKDPFAIVRAKAAVAGVVNTTLGLMVARGAVPPVASVVGAMVLGSLSYGVSVVLDAYALRLVGAAREAAYFATAPFVGVLAAAVLFRQVPGWWDWAAMALMALGVVLLLREKHAHEHHHEALAHEHLHRHDEHHRHEHAAGDPPGEPHSHPHRHAPLVHSHAHVSDAHHRHEH